MKTVLYLKLLSHCNPCRTRSDETKEALEAGGCRTEGDKENSLAGSTGHGTFDYCFDCESAGGDHPSVSQDNLAAISRF